MKFALLIVAVVSLAAGEDKPFEALDQTAFAKLVSSEARVQKLATGVKFAEGPVWMPGGFLVFSDNQGDELKKWDGEKMTTFRKPTGMTNGNTLDNQGRLIDCVQWDRGIGRTKDDGSVEILVDSIDGKKFNSPNDVVVKSDDTIWFTDPPYGVPPGKKRELTGKFVYRFDPKTKAVSAVVTDLDMPNGLCFSPDEKRLYVADSGKPRLVNIYDIDDHGTAQNGRLFCKIDKGVPDGMRIDADGRLWTTSGDSVQIFDTDGTLIGKIFVPETPANLCFGGKDGHTLFITARHSLYSIETKVVAAKKPN